MLQCTEPILLPCLARRPERCRSSASGGPLLVLRDVCFGWNQFDEIHDHLGVARNILKARLDALLEQGMVERRRYQERPDRYEYVPTAKALDFRLGPGSLGRPNR